jgi:hypothetical protein
LAAGIMSLLALRDFDGRIVRGLRQVGRDYQGARGGNLIMGSSLNRAMVSSVM